MDIKKWKEEKNYRLCYYVMCQNYNIFRDTPKDPEVDICFYHLFDIICILVFSSASPALGLNNLEMFHDDFI